MNIFVAAALAAAALAAAALAVGAAHANETTHGGVPVRSTAIQPSEQARNASFAGISFQRQFVQADVARSNDPARGSASR